MPSLDEDIGGEPAGGADGDGAAGRGDAARRKSRATSSRGSSRRSTRPATTKPHPVREVERVFGELVGNLQDTRNCLRRMQGRVVLNEDAQEGDKDLAFIRFNRLQTELHSLCITSQAASDKVAGLAQAQPTEVIEELLSLLDMVNDQNLSDYLRILVYSSMQLRGSVAKRVEHMQTQKKQQKELKDLARLSSSQDLQKKKKERKFEYPEFNPAQRKMSMAWYNPKVTLSDIDVVRTKAPLREKRIEYFKTHKKLQESKADGFAQFYNSEANDKKDEHTDSLLFLDADFSIPHTPLPASDDEVDIAATYASPKWKKKKKKKKAAKKPPPSAGEASVVASLASGSAPGSPTKQEAEALQRALAELALKEETSPKAIYLRTCEGMKIFPNEEVLRSLDKGDLTLGGVPLGPEGVVAIADVIRKCSAPQSDEQPHAPVRWRTMELNNANITPAAATILLRTVMEEESSELELFNIHGNSVGDAGAGMLARMLDPRVKMKCACHLSTLDLSSNDVTDAGIARLLMAVEQNHTLRALRLANNEAGFGSARRVKMVLEQNDTLEELDLSNNALTPQHVIEFAKGFPHNASLKVLKVGGNRLGTSGVVALCQHIEKNTALTALDVSSSVATGRCVPSIEHLILHNLTLRDINVSFNFLGTSGVRTLELAQQRRQRPIEFNFLGCQKQDLLQQTQ